MFIDKMLLCINSVGFIMIYCTLNNSLVSRPMIMSYINVNTFYHTAQYPNYSECIPESIEEYTGTYHGTEILAHLRKVCVRN